MDEGGENVKDRRTLLTTLHFPQPCFLAGGWEDERGLPVGVTCY
jgi:hypothetical protein